MEKKLSPAERKERLRRLRTEPLTSLFLFILSPCAVLFFLLWLVNLCCFYRDYRDSKLRFFFAALAVPVFLLFCWSAVLAGRMIGGFFGIGN